MSLGSLGPKMLAGFKTLTLSSCLSPWLLVAKGLPYLSLPFFHEMVQPWVLFPAPLRTTVWIRSAIVCKTQEDLSGCEFTMIPIVKIIYIYTLSSYWTLCLPTTLFSTDTAWGTADNCQTVESQVWIPVLQSPDLPFQLPLGTPSDLALSRP